MDTKNDTYNKQSTIINDIVNTKLICCSRSVRNSLQFGSADIIISAISTPIMYNAKNENNIAKNNKIDDNIINCFK